MQNSVTLSHVNIFHLRWPKIRYSREIKQSFTMSRMVSWSHLNYAADVLELQVTWQQVRDFKTCKTGHKQPIMAVQTSLEWKRFIAVVLFSWSA